MPVYDAPSESGGAEDTPEDEAGASCDAPLGVPFLGGARPHRLILKREAQRLVLFQGWPEGDVLSVFQALRMTIGLALTADDYAERRQLEGYDYAFIGAKDQKRTVFASALRDLALANWSIDREASRAVQEASWSVIVGGYQPAATAEAQRPSSPERQDAGKRQELQRMEA